MNSEEIDKIGFPERARKAMKHKFFGIKSPKYLKWVALEGDNRKQGHHIVGKNCDYLLYKMFPDQHMQKPYEDFQRQYNSAIHLLAQYTRQELQLIFLPADFLLQKFDDSSLYSLIENLRILFANIQSKERHASP